MGEVEGTFLWFSAAALFSVGCFHRAGSPLWVQKSGIGSLAVRCQRPPSHASLSLLQEELAQQLDALQTHTKQTLLSALPGVAVSSQQVGTGSLSPPSASAAREGQTSKCPFSPLSTFFKLRIMTRGYKSLRRRPWKR